VIRIIQYLLYQSYKWVGRLSNSATFAIDVFFLWESKLEGRF
jgi:hypothetical protein